jgi:hypothetical protein
MNFMSVFLLIFTSYFSPSFNLVFMFHINLDNNIER